MKKSLVISSGLIGLAAAVLITVPGLVQAEGARNGSGSGYGYERAITSKAKVLGMTADALKTALKDKTMLEIAKDKGLTLEQIQAKMREAAEARWKERDFSQEEIASRKKAMEERQADCDGSGSGAQMRGNR